GNHALGVVRPAIANNVNFEIMSQFMRELMEDTFSGNKNDDVHEHVEKVLDIVSLFNTPRVTHDAIMLRVFPITLTDAAKRRGSSDGIVAITSKLDSLGRDMKKLKENVHAIQGQFEGQKGKTKMVKSGTADLRLHSCKPIQILGNDTCNFWPRCDPNLKDYNGGDSIYGLDEQGVLKQWYCYRDNERIDVKEKEILVSDFLQIRYGNNKIDDTTRARRMVMVKIWHTNVNKSVKNAVLNERILDSFDVEPSSSGMSNDPYSRDLKECRLVFNNEIKQLVNEYKLRIGKKGTSWTTYGKNVNKSMAKRCTCGTTKDLKKKNCGRVV
nr:hypothetical protein [Tanacetum cinerariifolium]